MSLWSRIRRAFNPGPTDDFWYSPIGAPSTSGIRVSEETALKYLTVFSCVSLIAGDVARLPLNLYKRRGDGGKDLISNDLSDLLHSVPNPDTTSFNFRETLQGHLLLWGNSYAFIDREKNGTIKALWQIPDPGGVEVARVGGNIVYKYQDENGRDVVRQKDTIFHIPGYGFDGLVGLSMISLAREAIGMGLATEQFGSEYFGQGTHPAGVLQMDGTLGDNREEFVKAIQKGYAGLGNAHKVMLLENGMKYNSLTVPLNDAQFLESRAFQRTEISGFYHVPPHKIGQHGQNSNYNNLEQENASYVDSCLMHWVVRWESAISQQLLTKEERKAGYFFEFLVQGLLRGDSASRAEYYNKIFQVGGITPNEIRAKENMNPLDGGDQSFVMLNMIPLDKADEVPVAPKIEEIKAFFKGDSEKRSIVSRDRIARQYEPLIFEAAKAVVVKESKAIKAGINRASVDKFLTDFYKTFPEFINQKMSPVLRSYMKSIVDSANDELGLSNTDFDIEVKGYIDRYVERHIESSEWQMRSLMEEPEKMETRVDEWQETRAERIAVNEAVRASGAAYSFVVFGAGLSLTWKTRGAETCPYCKIINNKRISSGESFLADGDVLDPPDGGGPMKIRGLKRHPPAHRGCNCYVLGS